MYGRSLSQMSRLAPQICLRVLPISRVHNGARLFHRRLALRQSDVEQPKQVARRWMDEWDKKLIALVRKFHDVTGFSEIEKLKRQIQEVEDQITSERQQVKTRRDSFTEASIRRSASQQEMNELLLRKQAWTPVELERFTQLYKDDHALAQEAEQAKSAYELSETKLEELQLQLGRLIGLRYREEQLWSDKIRQASTWGTWALMAINVVLFVVVQLLVEPWKRKRLVASFEAKVAELIQNSDQSTSTTKSHEPSPEPVRDEQPVEPLEPVDPLDLVDSTPVSLTWRNLWERLHQQTITLRPVEIASALALAPLITLTVQLLANSLR